MSRIEELDVTTVRALAAGEIDDGAEIEVVGRLLPAGGGRRPVLAAGPFTAEIDSGEDHAFAWVRVRGRWREGAVRPESVEELRPPLRPPDERQPESRFVREPGRLQAVHDRTRAIREIRSLLDEAGFVEATTPFVQSAAEMGFIDQLFTDVLYGRRFFLRTDPEEYLKRYVTAGLEAVYEVSTNFRTDFPNERRLNEFASVEYYRRLMTFEETLELGDRIVRRVVGLLGGETVTWGGVTIDTSRPFPRVTYRDATLEATGIDIDAPEVASAEALADAARAAGLDVEVDRRLAGWRRTWLEALLDAYARPRLTGPTWITYFPAELALNARIDPEEPKRSLLAELYLPGGLELGRVYELLTHPIELRERYVERRRHRVDGGMPDVPVNEGLMGSAEIGMPPMGGGAIGVDRMVMVGRGDEEIGRGLLFAREALFPSAEDLPAEEGGERT